MKTIIAGCRHYTDYDHLRVRLDQFREKHAISEIVSGNALGERYAQENDIKLKLFPADWKTHNRAAGPIRNRQINCLLYGIMNQKAQRI